MVMNNYILAERHLKGILVARAISYLKHRLSEKIMPDHETIHLADGPYEIKFEYFKGDHSVGVPPEYHILSKPDCLTDGEVIEELEIIRIAKQNEIS
jgi:hypothetical protein